MEKIFKICEECHGYGDKDDPCEECCNYGGYEIHVNDIGNVMVNIKHNKYYPKDVIEHIKRYGKNSQNYPHYYHVNGIRVKEIVNSNTIKAVIGEYGRKIFNIRIEDYYE